VEEDFIRELFTEGETQLGRVFVHEPALPAQSAIHVLDYERASEVIRTATPMAVGTCYCRHKMVHVGRACKAPLDICMTFNTTAQSLIRHGHARKVDPSEGMDLLQLAYDRHLVQFGENVRRGVNFICNCCGCCCEAMIAARRFAILRPVHTTNYFPRIGEDRCNGCGKCVDICPVEAVSLVSANDPKRPKRKTVRIDPMRCLGCGLCARVCPSGAMALEERPQRVLTPATSAHRAVVMALERGKLQNLIFDNQVLFSHRALAVILRLPPLQRALASEQVKSRYLEALMLKLS
jgi:ferredoxin